MYPHRIRLRGPWECVPLQRLVSGADGVAVPSIEALPPPCRVTLPGRWRELGLGFFSGRVLFRRRFGIPRTLDAHERVWLTFAGVEGKLTTCLNGQGLELSKASPGALEFDVTSLIRARNELVVEVTSLSPDGGLWGEVALEIRCTAYLRNVQVQRTTTGAQQQLQISGCVAGSSEQPLEVYVLCGRSTVAYSPVIGGDHMFSLISEPLNPENTAGEIRVELVCGPTVWYAMEVEASRL